jgi:uncharacterized protein (UPF0332 family)
MSVTATDFLNSAKALLSVQATEIDFRNALSRTYYSIFHLTKPVAEHLPHLPQTTQGSHDAIISRFTRYPSTDPHWRLARSIGVIMEQMKTRRRKADYQIDLTMVQKDAELQLQEAQKVTDRITQLKNTLSIP